MTTFELEQTQDGTNLVVQGEWSSEAAAVLQKGRANGLVLNYARGFRSNGSLDFLTPDLPIRRLFLLDRSIEDASPIGALSPRLETLTFEAAPGVECDIRSMPHLRSIAAPWAAIEKSVQFGSTLESISTTKYSAPDLLPVCTHTGLRFLQLKEVPDLTTLRGLSSLHRLETLRIGWAVRLSDLSELSSVAGTLTELRMERCRGIASLEAVAGLTNLRFLEFSDGPTIPSFAPLSELRNLEHLYLWGTTRAADNDLSPLTRLTALTDLRIQERREYRPAASTIRGAGR